MRRAEVRVRTTDTECRDACCAEPFVGPVEGGEVVGEGGGEVVGEGEVLEEGGGTEVVRGGG